MISRGTESFAPTEACREAARSANSCNVAPATPFVDFGGIATPIRRLTAKEFLYTRLNKRVMGIKQALPVQVARQELNFLLASFCYLNYYHDATALRAVSQEVLDGYRVACAAGGNGRGVAIRASAVANYLSVTIRLGLCGQFLSHDRLEVIPWRGRSAYVVAGVVEQTENATPRIPEAVLGGLLRWALFYVEVAAADVLAGSAEIAAFENQPKTAGDPRAALAGWIATRRAAGRGLPAIPASHGWARPLDRDGLSLNRGLVWRMAGLRRDRYEVASCRRLLDAAVAELGLELGGLDTAVSIDPATKRPWRSPFTPHDLVVERRMVQAACYIGSATVRHARLRTPGAAPRLPYRRAQRRRRPGTPQNCWVERSKAGAPRAAQATWVVIDPVAQAVEVLEAMHGHDHLMTSPGEHTYPSAARRSGDLTDGARLGPALVRILNDFRDHVNATQSGPGQAAIPDHDGRPWHFTTGQFRRTLAWHIANQPFGTVAGMLQYQHVSVATFEGYVGQSASGFRQEVDTERRLAALDDLVEDYTDHVAGIPSTGAGAAKRNVVFAHVDDGLGAGAVVDDVRLRAMLRTRPGRSTPGS
jgi:hypothetical protein